MRYRQHLPLRPPFVLVLVAAVLVVALVWVIIALRTRPHKDSAATGGTTSPDAASADSGTSAVPLITALAGGDARAAARLRGLARHRWGDIEAHVESMLTDDQPQVRAVACDLIGQQVAAPWLPAVVLRASDSDWRVRAAAFAALEWFTPLPAAPPLRDTLLADREAILLAWLDAHDRSATAPLGPDLCEVYAQQAHVEVGPPLAQRCLACHVGPPRPASPTDGACGDCHGEIHEQWSGSAHANSVLHLRLTSVNPVSRQPEAMIFDGPQGLGCTTCHIVAEQTGEPALPPAPQPRICRFTFNATASPADTCRPCHRRPHAQWQTWRNGPQPRRLAWPPGQVDATARGDTRNCIDCHMPPPATADAATGRDHRLAARRDSNLLRAGLDVSLRPVEWRRGRRVIPLILTNLAGHAFPTGTRRRAVRVYVEYDQPEGEQLICEMIPATITTTDDAHTAALAPGEQRRLLIDLPPGATTLRCRIVYLRDRFDRQAFQTDIAAFARKLPVQQEIPGQ